ncbi:MAG TPA: T9SS type A sorting domain-containing protein [Caldithrix abyssi]|uniref:T9SS type A sorting domain-containing protein n=1 Tax=Caldithrix abyssi TaxID=187145 RepID=A0A7V5UEE5_CALAY|nr:T9SS type A sorting domain-containing protein [Caldithrix abyssi]
MPRSINDFVPATAIEKVDEHLPITLKLYPAYPNPFNPATTLRFDIPANVAKKGDVSLAIYSVQGQKVKTLTISAKAGTNRAVWNADSDSGQPVAAGVYYAVLRAGQARQVVKLLLVK